MSGDLLSLGIGNGSQNETLKLQSNYLRGRIPDELAKDTSHFEEAEIQLLKFHGTYQQEDRDQRKARKANGLEKAYQFMVRTRIPGGALTAQQYLAHDSICERFANRTLRITTRQGIQLHGVLKGNLRAAIHDINDALVSTLAACGDVNRNVMACAAPVGDVVHTRLQELAHELAVRLAPRSRAYHEIWVNGEKLDTPAPAEPDSEPLYGPTYLPRKFKIGIAYPGDNCIDVYTQDIGLIAELANKRLSGFTVVVGGGLGMTHGKSETFPRTAEPLCFSKPEDVVELAEAIVTVQRDFGDRKNRKHARMKYLIEDRGIEWFRGEVERRLGRALESAHHVQFEDVCDHLGWQRQADSKWFLGIYVENGRVKDTSTCRLRTALRHIIARFKPEIRLTGQQNILLTGIVAHDRAAISRALLDHGVLIDPHQLDLRRYAMACPAMPTCGLALTDAERALPSVVAEIQAELAELGLSGERLSIRMTGCPNGCSRPYMGDVGFVGRSLDLYDIFLGGDWANTRLNAVYQHGVRRGALASVLRPVLRLWKNERSNGETFGDYCHRAGFDYLRQACQERSLA